MGQVECKSAANVTEPKPDINARSRMKLNKEQEDEYFRNRFPHLEDLERDVNKIDG